jgi:PAS domain S-box-containing protein
MDIFSAAEQTFKCRYTSLQMPALLLDEHARIVQANSAFVGLSGVDVLRLTSAGIDAFLDAPVPACLRDALPGSAGAEGCSLRLADGTLLPVDLLSVPLHDGDVCRGWFLFVLEGQADARVQSPGVPHASVPATRDFLLNIIEASYDGIVIADMNDECLHINSALERITGYSRDFFIGRRFSDYIEVENWADELNPEKVARVDETGQISYEAAFRRRDGCVVYLENGVSLVRDAAGDCVATVWVVRDITDQKTSAQALKQACEYRSRFFTAVTHEFRTPLTLTIGPLENLLRGDFGRLEGPVNEQLTAVLQSSRLLLHMVDHLVDFSRLQSGAVPVSRTRVSAQELCAVVLDAFEQIREEKHMTFDCSIQDTVPWLHTDPVHVLGLLHDLLSCALAAAPTGSALHVAASREDPSMRSSGGTDGDAASAPRQAERVRLSIEAYGASLGAEQCRRLFACSDVSAAVSEVPGFMLRIRLMRAHALAETLGVELAAEDIAGDGVRFVLSVPAAADAPQDTDASSAVPQCVAEGADPEIVFNPAQEKPEPVSGTRPLIMIVEDNAALSSYVSAIVQQEYDAVVARDGLEALEKMQSCAPDLILSDTMMPNMDGYELLRTVKASEQLRIIPFVVLSARADIEMKIAGLQEGADDYIVKPFNALELMARIKSLLRLREQMMKNADQARQISSMTTRLQERYRYGALIGKSASMRKIYQLIDSIHGSDATVLITGETGTGKELVANAIHYSSRRSAGPLISVNCGAIPRELMEREFFGHVKGAYTGAVENRRGYFAEADRGTLFLDEIGEMDRDMQVKLLRVLERGEVNRVGDPIARTVDVRLITATNKDLLAEVRAGRFREDLYYRLFVIPVHIPPLRERRDDIPLLIEHFREKLKKKMNIDSAPMSEQDYLFFAAYDYPGNVRELENMIERYCLLGGAVHDLAAGGTVTAAAGKQLGSRLPGREGEDMFDYPDPLKRAQNMAARDLIMHALEQCGNNHVEAARMLGIARSSLYRKISELGIGH